MMRSLFIFIFCLFISNLFSQNYLTFSIGNSIPQADLRKTNLEDSSTGYAKSGASFQAKYEHVFKSGFGLYAQYKTAKMGINEGKLIEDSERKLGAGYKNTSMDTKGYGINAINFGAQFTINRNHNFHIIPSLGFGLTSCKTRYIDATFKNGVSELRYIFDEETSSVSNFHWGLDLGIKISNKCFLFYNYQAQIQGPEFKNYSSVTFNNIFTIRGEDKRQSIWFFTTNMLGVKFEL